MTDTRDHPPGDRDHASLHLPAGGTVGSHLSHWPPPLRGHEVRPMHPLHHVTHQPGEPAEHARPHGLGLTRSIFKEDGDE